MNSLSVTPKPSVLDSSRIIEHERSRARGRIRRTKIVHGLTTAAIVVVLLIAWQIAAVLFLTPLGVAASPSAIVQSLISDWSLYSNAAVVTGWVAIRGWLWGNLIAVVVAVLFVQIPFVESLFLRLALVLFCLPLVAVNPILQLTFEPDTARVVLTGLSVFFTTLVGTILGLRSADGGPLTMVHAWGGGGTSRLRYVRFPSAFPAIMTGLQVGVAAAVLGAIFGEFIGATRGIGVLLINGLMSLQLDRIWSIAVIATLMAAIPYALFGILRDRLAPWSSTISSANPIKKRTVTGPARILLPLAWSIGSVVIVLVAWWAYLAIFDVSPFVGKSPADVLAYLTTVPDAAENRTDIAAALGITLLHGGVGYIAGLTVGVTAAVTFVQFPVVERIMTPIAVAFRTVPIIVIIPILILSLGRGLGAVVAITAIVTFFPTLANTQNGLARVPADGFSVMRSYDASRWTTLWRLQLPYTLPAIFTSARIAVPSALLAATLAEWLATGDGLGHYIVASRASADYTGLWAGAAVLTIVSLLVYSAVSIVERRVLAKYSPAHVA
ncbi:ABC transporter permease [Paenarthrobacter sp. RAF54_2]|uniref:ABC transporter permease n=1 Tax=Paenarthrobacter sp. RAF54_2 TaxID=3233061 RepID=UPI003F9E2C71